VFEPNNNATFAAPHNDMFMNKNKKNYTIGLQNIGRYRWKSNLLKGGLWTQFKIFAWKFLTVTKKK